MSGAALGLVLTAALLHATWNLAAKGAVVDRVAFIWLYVVAICIVWAPVAVVWVLATGERPEPVWVGGAAVSAVLHSIYQLVLQRGYAEGDLNLVYPLARGAGPLLTFLVAVALLGQYPGPVGLVGVVAVVGGVLLISLGRASGPRGRGVLWGLATGVTIASYTLWDNVSVNRWAVPPVPYFVLGCVLQLPLLALLLARRTTLAPVPEVWRAHRAAVLTIALLSPLAYVLVLRAMQLAPVALVAPAREASIVVGAGFGWLVLHEPAPARRLAGAAVVLAGIALLALG